MESNFVIIVVLQIIIILILVHKIGGLKAKIDDYEERLIIRDRPRIPSSRELMDMWAERQFHIHTFYAFFPILLRWKKRIIELSKENSKKFILRPEFYNKDYE